MLVPVMLLGTGCESAARKLQSGPSHCSKIRLFAQTLARVYVSFDKASEQLYSVLYAFSHRHRRKLARLLQRHLRFADNKRQKSSAAISLISRRSTISRSAYCQSNCSMTVRDTNFGDAVISCKELGGGARLKWNSWPIRSISRRCRELSRC
jgi:hypothetical protein